MPGKKKSKRTRETAQIKVLITKNAGDPNDSTQIGLSRIKKSIALQEIDLIVNWIKSNARLNRLFFSSEFPQTLKELEPDYILFPFYDEFEFRWSATFLSSHAEKLSEFVGLNKKFQRTVLRSEYENGLEILNEIETKFGHSFWLICNRLALLQISQGLEAQKNYLNKVIQENPASQFVAFIAFYTSIRNESSVTPNRFVELLMKNPSLFELPDVYQAFVWHHLFPQTEYTPNQTASILSISNCCSVIDTYEAFIKLAQSAVANNAKDAFSTLSHIVQKLFMKINDERLYPLIIELGKSSFDAPVANLKSVTAFDSLLRGDYQQARREAELALIDEPEIFDLWEIKAKADSIKFNGSSLPNSKGNGNEQSKTFCGNIIGRMSALLDKSEDIGEQKTELIKIALNFNSHSWANALLGFTWRESSNVPFFSREKALLNIPSAQVNLHPLRVGTLNSFTRRLQYIDLLNRKYPASLSLEYAARLGAGEENFATLTDLSPEEKSLATAESAFQNGNYNSALQATAALLNSAVNYYRHEAIKIKINCLLKLGLIEDAVKFVAPILVKELHINILIPLEELAKSIDKNFKKKLEREISLPIIYNLYSAYVGSDFNSLRNYAYEDFLLSNGIERPSELKSIANQFDSDSLIYFLESVALESVMDVSTVFKGSQDIAAERLKVCEYLIEINEAKTEFYQTEINEISRRLMLQRRNREIEQSKIYVDTESIKKKVAGGVGESFNRYVSLLKHNYSSADLKSRNEKLDQIGAIKKIVNKEGLEVFLLNLELPEKEVEQLFNSMFLQLRDEYVSGKEYGLDAYLSVRIRHGTLTNQLRSHFESLHLITQQESAGGPYKTNEHWKKNFEDANSYFQNYWGETFDLPNFLIELNRVLSDFSKNFDYFINEIVSEWIQIKKKSEDKGLFNFVYSYSDIQIYSKEIGTETTFDEFVENSFALFENRLKTCLNDIRHKFKNDCKNRITELLNAVQSEIEDLGRKYDLDTGDITVAIGNGRTGAMNLLDRIADWFTLSTSNTKAAFQLEDAIGLSESNVRDTVSNFRADISIPNEITLIRGEHFNSIVDIFLILFENVLRHSGIKNRATANVSVTCDANIIRIVVENKVITDVVTDQSKARLSLIKKQIASGEYVSSVTSEGGTGFYKIHKILKHDFQIEPDIDFGFKDDNRFFVDIKLPTEITETK